MHDAIKTDTRCTCGAPSDGKWADIHSPSCPAVAQPIPDRPGYYWAKWEVAADGTHEGDELTPAPDFEIVQVNANVLGWYHIKPDEAGYDERLSVSVHGVRETQWPDCFIWGERVADLQPNK